VKGVTHKDVYGISDFGGVLGFGEALG